MNTPPNLPENLSRSAKAGGGWMMLVFATDIPGLWFLGRHSEWPLVIRLVISLLPVIASVLYVRSIAFWTRGMDEMHQQLVRKAFLLAIVSFLGLSMTWEVLKRTDLFDVIVRTTNLHLARMPFSNCTFVVSLTYVLFGICYTHVVSRRFQ